MQLGTKGRQTGAWIVSILLIATAAQVVGQEPCELPLVVPDLSGIQTELRQTSRGPGLLITWEEPDAAISTCSSLIDTAGLGVPVALTGDYLDQVDRTLVFAFSRSGTVADETQNRFVCRWFNLNAERTGAIGGEINLSNTGGLWVRDGGGDWTQRNGGVPSFLPYTNFVDVARADDGTLIGAISAGSQLRTDPAGVFLLPEGGTWTEVDPETFGQSRRVARVAIDPGDSQNFAVGSRTTGLFVTADGGDTFTQWTSNLDPDAPNIPNSFEVSAMRWTDTRLYVAVLNYGLFISEDGGASFTRAVDLEVPSEPGSTTLRRPRINAIIEDPSDSDRILVGLTDHAVWESTDGGVNWDSSWVDYAGDPDASWRYTVISLDIDPADGDAITAGTLAQLIWRTTDGGGTWTAATTPFDGDIVKPEIRDVIRHEGALLGLATNNGVLETADAGQTWTLQPGQPFNANAQVLISAGTELLLPSIGGGVYEIDTPIYLFDTIQNSETDDELESLDLGLTVAFGEGSVTLEDADGDGTEEELTFSAVCQDFQGWIVWRSERGTADDMAMIGRYDKNNPETCIEGFCGDENFSIIPGCFSERRAACFDVSQDGVVSFYDDDVFNGFTYFYAITPFDFGDISTVIDPVAIDSPMVFPPRFPGDLDGDGPGDGNRFGFQVNTSAAAAVDGEEIYVYPNPLRLGSGIAGGEGEEVIWTNLPPESRIEIFTLAGDEIAELPSAEFPQEGGNIYWVARNHENRLLASGIYLWRVIMPERGDFWGKLVIIR